ncbi:hypothetical protein [Ruegeria sp. HKCCA4707]|uniref:hypothetical protein n=1 Tax=Ruegeria sp. HKCCA4707 TaxID=2682984 RepID=UPI001489740B|nr:hypothetical protein [Ruegeria sp. HKCCA4707]
MEENTPLRAGLWFRRAIRVAGVVLLVLSLGYIALEVQRNWTEVSHWRPSSTELVQLFGLTLVYILTLSLPAETWHQLVGVYGAEPRRRTWRSFGLAQIARYLPGNVAHLIGRAMVLRDGPLSAKQLGLATLLELIAMPAGAVLALLIAALVTPGVDQIAQTIGWSEDTVRFLTLISAPLLIAGLFITSRMAGNSKELTRTFCIVVPICALFMLGLGAIFGAIVWIVGQGPFLVATVAGICAWLVGYVTPGAPAGLGPREAVLLLFLSNVMPAGGLIVAVAVFRLVTVSGDLVCFAMCAAVLRNGAPA